MNRNPATRTRPTDHLGGALPPDAVVLVPAPPDAVPMRPPAGAWGLVVVAVRTTPAAGAPVRFVGDAPAADPAHTDTAALLAGVWLPAPPPAYRHDGDVVVRLHASTDTDDPAVADVEVLAAASGVWNRVDTWRSVGARWPHEIALSVLVRMRYLADAAFNDAQWAMLTGPIAAALPDELLDELIGESAGSPAPSPSSTGRSRRPDRGRAGRGRRAVRVRRAHRHRPRRRGPARRRTGRLCRVHGDRAGHQRVRVHGQRLAPVATRP